MYKIELRWGNATLSTYYAYNVTKMQHLVWQLVEIAKEDEHVTVTKEPVA